MGRLLTDAQLASIQQIAKLGMQTKVTIERRTATTGLETTDDPYGSSVSFDANEDPERAVVYGMLHSTPTPVAQLNSGQLVTINTYRLWVPVGTEIDPGDHVLIADHSYVVSDTTADETWPAFLACSLRMAE